MGVVTGVVRLISASCTQLIMFKKLKQKIEAGDEGGLERISLSPSKTPGSAVRSPPASDVSLTLTTPAHIQPVSPSHHIVSSPASHSEESRDHSPEKEEEEVTRVFSHTASVTCSITLCSRWIETLPHRQTPNQTPAVTWRKM